MPSQKTDEEIIKLYQEGAPEIFQELIEKYHSQIFSFVARLTGVSNAQDLTQDIFIKVWKNLKKFDSQKASFQTWIFSIARNASFDFLKKKKSVLFSDLETGDEPDFTETIPDENLLPDEVLQKLQDSSLLNKLLDTLPIQQKTILILHYQEEITFAEIGKILGKPLNTVKSHHHRAILELRKKLN